MPKTVSHRAAQSRYKKIVLLVEQLDAAAQLAGKLSNATLDEQSVAFKALWEIKAELLSSLHHNHVMGGL